MNRILFEPSEIVGDTVVFGGERAAHVLNVLHGEIGQTLKTGVLDGLIGSARIIAISPASPSAEATVTVRVDHGEKSLEPWVDLILAPPRPRVFKRLLPQLATLGVGKIVLVGAEKVEKDFWGATLLKPENYRPLLVDGLMQGGTSRVPELILRRRFRAFIRDELDALFPSSHRVVAHPYEAEAKGQAEGVRPQGRLLLAIGPEGGWTEREVELLEAKGFRRYSLGKRILRTDTATVALLAKLNTDNL